MRVNTVRYTNLTLAGFYLIAAVAQAAEDQTKILNKKIGDATLAKAEVDVSPGNVSAMSFLGISGDQTTVVQNPRNLTAALKTLDGKNVFGLSITPARTSLLPMDISTYNDGGILARLWASTTFSYAQGEADVNRTKFERRAFAIETSYFFFPHRDDPAVMYWDALDNADKSPNDADNTCNLHVKARQPEASKDVQEIQPVDDEISQLADNRAQACREKIAKTVRWNASRAWASWGSGSYQPSDGGDSHSLGRTAVVGFTWGIGDGHEINEKGKTREPTAAAITGAIRYISGAPVLNTFGNPSPDRKNNTLATLRFAVGSQKLRALLEASNLRDSAPTALNRTYKRAFGMDVNLAEGLWLNFRVGNQRRIDNTGDETGSTFSLSYSPKAILTF